MAPTVEYSIHAQQSTIWALAQQDPSFTVFYAQYQEQIALTTPLPPDFWYAVIATLEKDPNLSTVVNQYQKNAQAAKTFAVPGLPEAGVLIAALFLLSTHIKIHRTEDGKWEFLVEHNPSDDGILEKITQILSSLFKK